MKVLVACEFSGVVRDAFIARGHDTISCDYLPSDRGDPHIIGDVLEILDQEWDLIIAFPPCTHLATSGARWFKDKQKEQQEAIAFVEKLWDAPCDKICIENPIGVLSTKSNLGKPTQYIEPWQFGHGETKKTGLWLKGLPELTPTNIVEGRSNRIHMMPDTKSRWKKRSTTYTGIAKAMAEQWG